MSGELAEVPLCNNKPRHGAVWGGNTVVSFHDISAKWHINAKYSVIVCDCGAETISQLIA